MMGTMGFQPQFTAPHSPANSSHETWPVHSPPTDDVAENNQSRLSSRHQITRISIHLTSVGTDSLEIKYFEILNISKPYKTY